MTDKENPTPEIMEVHHHPDLNHNKKHFREYFLEFLMIFLAVTMGFISENIREHYVEHERAKTLAGALIEDLAADSAKLNWAIGIRQSTLIKNDSLLKELQQPMATANKGRIQVLCEKVSRPWYYLPFNGTYEQAKNSGSLRYFTAGVSKALTRYEQMNKQLAFGQDLERSHLESSILPMLFSVLNNRYLESLENGPIDTVPTFKRSDPHTLDDLYSVAAYTRSMNTFLLQVYTAQREEAKKDIQLLQTEYPD
jgi:hypothetical protein